MSTQTFAPVTEPTGQSDPPHGSAAPIFFSLLYSGMDSGQILMGDGVVTYFSQNEIVIRGNRPVKPGMELTLFVDLPDIEEPLCIAPSRVSWVAGRRFGVELDLLTLEEANHLRFLRASI